MNAKYFLYTGASFAIAVAIGIALVHRQEPVEFQSASATKSNDARPVVGRDKSSYANEIAIAHLDAKLDKLEHANNELQRKLKDIGSKTVQKDSEADLPADATITSPATTKEIINAHHLQARLEDEFVDFEWAGSTEKKILDMVDEEFRNTGDLLLKHVQCHMTMCKVEVAIKEQDNIQESLVRFSNNLGWDATIYTEYDVLESGEVVAQSFIMREGHQPLKSGETM